ncbi:haloacid dehalogenase-like hydrolase [Entomomonas asaccharolytica]|uniref:haloacid dehalogenase-like hydrolase n=1 Tax=Entomomonas asaccharolytica TaxID=2785331 RepID=UPI001F33BE55|nr:HAD family hydrolase [Entomomonas asaccharolytica]
MLKVSKLIIALAAATGLVTTHALAEVAKTNPVTSAQTVTVTAPQLIKGNWDSFNRDQLNKLIATYGKTSPTYDTNNPPYAVFDWDNTSVFLDIQEALLVYQIENLYFKMTPETLNKVLRMNVPSDNFTAEDNNLAGKPVNIDLIAQDIVNNYTWIYNNFDQMKGKKSLADIKKTDQYKEFSSKLRYLYTAIGNSFDASLSYPWVTYLFTGLTEHDVAKLTSATVDWQATQPIEDVTWTSPAIASKAGQVSTVWHNGLRLVPEMQDLYHKLREAGIDVWVCSASFIDVIKEISSNPKFGYNNQASKVIAMELERDANGVIQPEFRKGFNQTQGPGKTLEIKRLIAPKYNNKGPILVAGDSEGDQNMAQDFADTKIVIIVNRLRKPTTDIGKFSKVAVDTYKKPDAKFLLQGRNENTGLFTGDQKTIKLGAKEGQALR